MAYEINTAIVGDYINGVVETSYLNDTGIIAGIGTTQVWGGNAATIRGFGTVPSLMDSADATTGTQIASYSMIAPVKRGLLSRTSNDFDEAAGGVAPENVNEATGILLGNDVLYNVEYNLFTNILPGSFLGSLSSTHYVNYSSSAFKINYVMEAQNKFGRPFQLGYLVVHPDLAGKSEIFLNRESNTDVNSNTPKRLFNSANYVGRINGIDVFSSSLCSRSGTGVDNYVYSSYLFGPQSVKLEWQRNWGVEQYRAGNASTTYRIARPMFAMTIGGVSYTGTVGTDTSGVASASLLTGSNWTRLTDLNDYDINVVQLKTKIAA